LSGNQMDIECGTHIKIPMDAGYVSYYKSLESEQITFWMRHEFLMDSQKAKINSNVDEDGYIDK